MSEKVSGSSSASRMWSITWPTVQNGGTATKSVCMRRPAVSSGYSRLRSTATRSPVGMRARISWRAAGSRLSSRYAASSVSSSATARATRSLGSAGNTWSRTLESSSDSASARKSEPSVSIRDTRCSGSTCSIRSARSGASRPFTRARTRAWSEAASASATGRTSSVTGCAPRPGCGSSTASSCMMAGSLAERFVPRPLNAREPHSTARSRRPSPQTAAPEITSGKRGRSEPRHPAMSVAQKHSVARRRYGLGGERLACPRSACKVRSGAHVRGKPEGEMQSIRAWGLALAVAAGASWPVTAQEACVPTLAAGKALGVSRVVEIDTSSGPLFGAPYKEASFLADGEVVLTFDDGPLRAYTMPVLDALAAHCARATFFLVGRMAVADPETVKEYARRGHTVGTHTWSHQNLKALTPLKARAEIELGFSAVQHAMGQPLAPFFRFPFLSDPKSMIIHLQERQVGIFSIDVDSKDYRTRDPGSVHRKVMADLGRTKKGIVLFHDIQPSTARALPSLLADLQANGHRIVHIKPKAQATTIAEFDSQAQAALDKRRATVADQPLAKRALTWPAAAGSPPTVPVVAKMPSPARPPRVLPAVPAKQGENWRSNFLMNGQSSP